MKFRKLSVFAVIFVMSTAAAVLFGTPSELARFAKSIMGSETPLAVADVKTDAAVMTAPATSYVAPFHFLEPLAPRSGDPAKFDDSLLNYLKVEICSVGSSECPLVKTLTAQSSSAERLRIEKAGGWTYYIGNFDTQKVNLANRTFRVRVFAADLLLGEVDLTPDIYKTFGRTWPIKFMIEKDPAIRVRVLHYAGKVCAQIASALKTEFGLTADEVGELLASDTDPCSAQEIDLALRGVFQDVIIPKTTKIADDTTGGAMSSFDPNTGTIVFSIETPLLKDLAVGDVLVGDPNSVAPYGYLKKVKSKTKVKGQIILQTTQASLTEAVYQGTLDAHGELLPEDEVSTGAPVSQNVASLTADAIAPQSSDAAATVCSDSGGSSGYNFECTVDVTIDGNTPGPGEFTGTGHVHIAGKVSFNAGYDIGMGVELCARVPVPACVDRFEARLRVKQKSELHIDGTLDAKVFKEIVVTRKFFKPILFMVGPVPVWIQPIANLVVGAKGDAHVSFSFDASDEANFAVGAKWTDPGDEGKGWENVSEGSLTGNADASLSGSLDLRGYYKGNGKLLLYGVAGPSFGAFLGGRAHFQIPGNPVWAVYGRIDGDLVFELSVLDVITLAQKTFDEFLIHEEELKRSGNFAPRCSTSGPGPITVDIDSTHRIGPTSDGSGFFNCMDPEGEAIRYEFMSNFPTTDKVNNLTHTVTFGKPFEVHRITVIATDASKGVADPLGLDFIVYNPPPVVEAFAAVETVPIGVQYFVNALVYDPDQHAYLSCIRQSPGGEDQSRVIFSATKATVNKIGDGFNCSAEIIFQETGPQTVTIEGIDKNNASGFRFITVNVTPRPANSPPTIDVSSISYKAIASDDLFLQAGVTRYICERGEKCPLPNGAEVSGSQFSLPAKYDQPFYMSLSASDPDGTVPTVTWFCRDSAGAFITVKHIAGNEYSCDEFGPARDVFIGATVFDGFTTVYSEIRKYQMRPLANPN